MRLEALTHTSRLTTIVQMTNHISGWQGAAGIRKITMTKATSAMPSPPPTGDDGLRFILKGLTWVPVISKGMRATIAMMEIWMRKKNHRNTIIDQRRMWRTEGIVGLAWEPVMSTSMRVKMATMRMLMRRKKHRKPIMDQCRMWRTESIVPESVKIGHYISNL